jgi:Lon protease-like protein
MPRFDAADKYLQGFKGSSPLFPTWNAVLFPHALLPLHIFEPRYRKLTADALEGDGFVSLAIYQPRPEGLVVPIPAPIHSIVGVGKIIASDRLADGRYYLALQGLSRARVLEELPTGLPYRTGRLECLEDVCEISLPDQISRATEIGELFQRMFPQADLKDVLLEAMECPQPLSVVTDLLSATIPFAVTTSQMLLETPSPEKRADTLLLALKRLLQSGPAATSIQKERLTDFPPPFSAN